MVLFRNTKVYTILAASGVTLLEGVIWLHTLSLRHCFLVNEYKIISQGNLEVLSRYSFVSLMDLFHSIFEEKEKSCLQTNQTNKTNRTEKQIK